jgi:hypothetical protein
LKKPTEIITSFNENSKKTASKIIKELSDEQQLYSSNDDEENNDKENKHEERNKKRKHSEKFEPPKQSKLSLSKNTKKLFNNDSSFELNLENESGNDNCKYLNDHAGDSSYLVFGSSSENESYYPNLLKNKKHSTGVNKKFKADNDITNNKDDELKVSIIKPSTSKAASKSGKNLSKSPVKTMRGLAKLASNTTPPLINQEKHKTKDEDEEEEEDRSDNKRISTSISSISGNKCN